MERADGGLLPTEVGVPGSGFTATVALLRHRSAVFALNCGKIEFDGAESTRYWYRVNRNLNLLLRNALLLGSAAGGV